MNPLEVKIINKSNNPNPSYQTEQSAGMDLHAFIDSTISIEPGQRKLIATGLHIELPTGYEAQIRPRSGLALKHGITVLNSPGTIDADYRGEIMVLLINLGDKDVEIHSGDRIAQMIVAPHSYVQWQSAEALNSTERGEGGYGSSGK